MAKCSICHSDLMSTKTVCMGRKPGPLGIVQFSPGKCLSTPLDRAEVTSRRAARAKK